MSYLSVKVAILIMLPLGSAHFTPQQRSLKSKILNDSLKYLDVYFLKKLIKIMWIQLYKSQHSLYGLFNLIMVLSVYLIDDKREDVILSGTDTSSPCSSQ